MMLWTACSVKAPRTSPSCVNSMHTAWSLRRRWNQDLACLSLLSTLKTGKITAIRLKLNGMSSKLVATTKKRIGIALRKNTKRSGKKIVCNARFWPLLFSWVHTVRVYVQCNKKMWLKEEYYPLQNGIKQMFIYPQELLLCLSLNL